MITRDEVLRAWSKREILAKGVARSPGLPVKPAAPHKRAPRPRHAFYDVVEDASHPSAPEQAQPVTEGDLQQLEQQTSYDKTPQRATRVRSAKKVSSGSARIRQSSQRLARLHGTRPGSNVPYYYNLHN